MFSLRVAVILALSTRFVCYGVCGQTVAIPYSADDPSSEESNYSIESTSTVPSSINTPVIETATLPTLRSSSQSSSVATSSSSVSISGSSHVGGKSSCICRECSPENGCFIKHFRQYNYYYPNGRKVTLPCQHPDFIHSIRAGESTTHDDTSDASSTSTANDDDIMKVKTSAKPTMRHHLPGVTSYVPNNGFNYIHHNLASVNRQKDRGQTLDESNDDSDGEHASSDESAEQTTEPTASDDETTTSSSPDDDNIEEDIITYLTEPHMFGHTRRTVIKNGNNGHFQSKHIITSSRMQSKSSPDSEPQQKASKTSSSHSQPQQGSKPQQQSSMTSNTHSHHSSSSSGSEPQKQDKTSTILQSQPLLGFGPAINWPGDINFGSPNRMTVGFNPFFQTQPLGVSPAILQPPTPPQLPVPAFQNKINWLGGSPPAPQAFQPAPCPYFGPVRTWPNMPPSLPLFDFGSMSPSYSVIL